MSNYEILLSNIDKLEENILILSENPISLSKFLLPTNEIIKKIIMIENPLISTDDIALMVDGFGSKEDLDNIRNGITTTTSKTFNELLDLEAQAGSDIKYEEIKQLVNDSIGELVTYPLNNPSDTYFQKAEELKLDIKNSFDIFQQKTKDLLTEVNISSLMIANSIPGSLLSGSITPFVPNIPGAISNISNVMLVLKSLKSKFISILPELKNIKKINIILTSKGVNVISGFLNGLISLLNGLILNILKKINDFINLAINSLLSHINSTKEEKRARKIARQLRNYKYLPNNNFNQVDDEDKDDVELILQEWEVVEVGSKKPGKIGKVKRRNSIEDSLSKLNDLSNQLNDINDLLPTLDVDDEFETLYDVELANGEKLLGLTIQEVNSLSSKYELIFASSIVPSNI
jgi:hypothetical protein